MRAQIHAKLAFLHSKCFFRGDDQQKRRYLLERAEKEYKDMLACAGTAGLSRATTDGDEVQEDMIIEQWFLEGQNQYIALQVELDNLREDSKTAAEREADDFAKPHIEEAKLKYEQDTGERKLVFMRWLNETHVPEQVRQQLPADAETKPKRAFGRWF